MLLELLLSLDILVEELVVSQLSLPMKLIVSSILFILFVGLFVGISSSLSYLFFAELKTNFCFPKIISSLGFKAF